MHGQGHSIVGKHIEHVDICGSRLRLTIKGLGIRSSVTW